MKTLRTGCGIVLLAVSAAWLSGCRGRVQAVPPPVPSAVPAPAVPEAAVTRTGYTVQVGAFSILDNARRLTQVLSDRGLDAFYFPQGTGLYKVRFGDFPTRDAADREAARLRAESVIGEYFIVRPEDHPVHRPGATGADLREKLAVTAESFIGVDYTWGGSTSREGFDCSGLVRAVYQLNGLNLPRSVAEQYRAGTAVPGDRLLKGDLLFFSASPGGPLSHVGIWVGEGVFIHAPGEGKSVRQESLSSRYYRDRFSGARTYLK